MVVARLASSIKESRDEEDAGIVYKLVQAVGLVRIVRLSRITGLMAAAGSQQLRHIQKVSR